MCMTMSMCLHTNMLYNGCSLKVCCVQLHLQHGHLCLTTSHHYTLLLLLMSSTYFGHVMDSLSSSSLLSLAKVKEIYSVKAETMTSKGERYPSGDLQVKAELRPRSHDGAIVPGAMEVVPTPSTSSLRLLVLTSSSSQWMVSIYWSPCNLNVRRTYSHQSMLSSVLVVQQLPS